jgi:hypothetical protein
MNLSHDSLHTVTSTSKIVAVILFLTLPFVGFYLGVQYERSGALDYENVTPVPAKEGSDSALERPSCLLLPKTGSCKAAMPRYFFNQATGECDVFTWGGCGGVVPFETMDACQQSCEVAEAPPVRITEPPLTAEPGGFCGGIVGIQCPDGHTCVLDGKYPDAGGTCKPLGAFEKILKKN